MNILYFNNLIFNKFLKFYNYRLFLYFSNKNLYCSLFSFFNFNIIFSLSTISIFLRNYICLNFGKFLCKNIFKFIAKCSSLFILKFKINKLFFKSIGNSLKLSLFLIYLKNYI